MQQNIKTELETPKRIFTGQYVEETTGLNVMVCLIM